MTDRLESVKERVKDFGDNDQQITVIYSIDKRLNHEIILLDLLLLILSVVCYGHQ